MTTRSTEVHLVVAARPNFMKVASLYHALRREPWCKLVLVHTGQHYDADMSDVFLRELGLPDPDFMTTGIEALAIGDCLLWKREQDPALVSNYHQQIESD